MKIASIINTIVFGVVILSVLCSFTNTTTSFEGGKRYYDSVCKCYVEKTYYNGNLLSVQQFVDSDYWIKTGVTVYFYENGDTSDLTSYQDGEMNGFSFNKHKNGMLAIVRNYKNNFPVGHWKYFDDKGFLVSEIIYESENLTEISTDIRLEKFYSSGGKLFYTKSFSSADSFLLNVIDTTLYNSFLQKQANMTGREIFMAICTSCHNPLKDATGPKLAGVTKRRTEKWLRSWISNSSKMIAEGDKQALALYNKWGKTSMTAFPLPDAEMNKLIDYLKSIE